MSALLLNAPILPDEAPMPPVQLAILSAVDHLTEGDEAAWADWSVARRRAVRLAGGFITWRSVAGLERAGLIECAVAHHQPAVQVHAKGVWTYRRRLVRLTADGHIELLSRHGELEGFAPPQRSLSLIRSGGRSFRVPGGAA